MSTLTRFIRTAFVAGMLAFLTHAAALAQTNAPSASPPTSAPASTNDARGPAISNQETLRSYLEIQEQLHSTQLALEHNRQEAEAASQRNADLLQATLSLVEKSLNNQRLEDFKDLERSNRLMLIAAGAFAAIGFVVLLFTAFLQWNAVRRLASVAASLPLASGHSPAELAEASVATGSLKDSTARFLGTIDRLEKRIHEMEFALKSPHSLTETASPNGHGHPGADSPADAGSPLPSSAGQETLHALLDKGETLLKLDQPEAALACFEEALSLDPAHAEAFVRKGICLERLQRWEEAIACYDHAIAADDLMTMAHLYKGGIFNRMGRYGEALECYEKALKTQEKAHTAKILVE
jgi:tetratricopeptide (TPR) repeat protein